MAAARPALDAAPDTRTRLVAAAAACFAEHGFHGTTIRAIADRAAVNVAASHYHFGSKRDLYLEVLRREFATIRRTLAARGAALPTPDAPLDRAALEQVLHARVKVMLDTLLGPPPSLHGTLMLREMCDPSAALPLIVREMVRPLVEEMRALVGRLEPTVDGAAVERCAYSVVGQAMFYRFAMPTVLALAGREAYPRGVTAALAEHITRFSLGGLRAVARGRGGRRAS